MSELGGGRKGVEGGGGGGGESEWEGRRESERVREG